jgi:23S rRNA pseudouridine1911/1915/1917 synthase
MDIKVLYEDNHIIAVYKPAGVLTQGDRTGEPSLMDDVKNYLKDKYKKTGNVFLGLVHRLDKPVAGIVLFGKTSKGASRLSEQFRNHTIQKTYYGIVVGKPKESRGVIKEKVNKISFFAEGFTNKTDEELLSEIKKATKTRTAELSYEVVKVGKPFDTGHSAELSRSPQGKSVYTLLKIMPKTGRFHQIRIQMQQMGCPILGDAKYGAKDILPDRSIALSATAISFKTATDNKVVNLEIPLPKEWSRCI